MSIRVGIIGYGNLGRGVECAICQNPDMELKVVFTRRNPEQVKILTEGIVVCRLEEAAAWKDKLDVAILWRKCHRFADADTGICQTV